MKKKSAVCNFFICFYFYFFLSTIISSVKRHTVNYRFRIKREKDCRKERKNAKQGRPNINDNTHVIYSKEIVINMMNNQLNLKFIIIGDSTVGKVNKKKAK